MKTSPDKLPFLTSTIAMLGRRTERHLTTEDAREIVANTSGFFQLLRAWAEQDDHAESCNGKKSKVTKAVSTDAATTG